MADKHQEEEKGGSGESGSSRWMLTYLDMITLLFGVFVIMYAMSTLDKGKAEAVAESLRIGFQGGRTIFKGPLTGGQTIMDNLYPLGTNKKAIYQVLREAFKSDLRHNRVIIKDYDEGISISIWNDVYFQLGSWELSKEAFDVLDRLAVLLKDVKYYIYVEGHTDDTPIGHDKKRRIYIDNWDLGALRAGSVVRHLVDQGLDPAQLSVHSFGMYRPLSANLRDSLGPEYSAYNRRVEIIIRTDKKYEKSKTKSWSD